MNPVIIDGFLKHDEFKKLQTYMMSSDFQWRFMPVIDRIDEEGTHKFRLFYTCSSISSNKYEIIVSN